MLLPILVSTLLGFAITPWHWVELHNKNPFVISLISSTLTGLAIGGLVSKDIAITIFCALAGIGGWLIYYMVILIVNIFMGTPKNPHITLLISSTLIGLTIGLTMSKDIITIILCALAGVGAWLISLGILWLLNEYEQPFSPHL
jgi:hypothetical protein